MKINAYDYVSDGSRQNFYNISDVAADPSV